MTLEPLNELTAAAEPAAAYRQVADWLNHQSQTRLNAALAASHSQEA